MNEFYQMKEEIRSFIKSEIERQNITRTELSRKSGVHTSTITAYLLNNRECYIQTIMLLLDALGYKLKVVKSDGKAKG